MSDLFTSPSSHEMPAQNSPLANRLRPQSLKDIVGQEHLLEKNSSFRQCIKKSFKGSLILWGPPGTGKTTLAKIIAKEAMAQLIELSAIHHGVNALRKTFDTIKTTTHRQKTLLFIDEIHRFNKAQQDAFLPVLEDGTVSIIGATTENPSFELNNALLSRCQVFALKPLEAEALEKLLQRAEEETQQVLPLTQQARQLLCHMADGDGRALLSYCELLFSKGQQEEDENLLDDKALNLFLHKRMPPYDKGQESHYNLISALHKAVRGSDIDAALYWFCRMVDGGEDIAYIARRLIRMASEDIGLADPNALPQAISAYQAYQHLGDPEGILAIAQSVLYLASSPKSNAAYKAYKQAMKDAQQKGSLVPPAHSLNAPTKLMKDLGYGESYIYDHDTKTGFSGLNYFPEKMQRQKYYDPQERGFERELRKRINYWEKLREKKTS